MQGEIDTKWDLLSHQSDYLLLDIWTLKCIEIMRSCLLRARKFLLFSNFAFCALCIARFYPYRLHA